MAKFIYLLRNNPTTNAPRSPQQMEQAMKKYMAWKERLEKNGHLLDFGAPLDGAGKVVRDHGQVVTDGPFVEIKDFIQGYMFIEAQDLDEAAALAKESPILDSGGSLEIRPVRSM